MKLFRLLTLLSVSTLGLVQAARAQVETYDIDPVHSSVGFSLRHFVSKVPGNFSKFSGVLTLDRANLENSKVVATIEVGSVGTNNAKRDGHLSAPDFFNIAEFPTATFTSTSWKKTGESTYDITGDLTLRGVTKPVTLHATLLAFGPGMGGAQLTGWEATAVINKADFGVTGPAMLGKALGDEVAITLAIEADLKK